MINSGVAGGDFFMICTELPVDLAFSLGNLSLCPVCVCICICHRPNSISGQTSFA